MNTTAILNILKVVLALAGGGLVAAGKLDQGSLDTAVNTIVQTVGALISAGTVLWAIWASRPAGLVKAANALPAVQKIEVTDPKLADKVNQPGVTVAPPSM